MKERLCIDLNTSLSIVANTIWFNGETKKIGSGRIVPTDCVFNGKPKDYNFASDFLEDLGYTHFDLKLRNCSCKFL